MLLQEAFEMTLYGFYFSVEGITGTPLMAGQIKTFIWTCKCSEFSRAGADSQEIGKSEK